MCYGSKEDTTLSEMLTLWWRAFAISISFDHSGPLTAIPKSEMNYLYSLLPQHSCAQDGTLSIRFITRNNFWLSVIACGALD